MKAKAPGRTRKSGTPPTSQKPERIENPGVIELDQRLAAGSFERVLLCEGDSWFDIYTPWPLVQPNLLDALRTPRKALLVDISHVGDTAKEMATDPQAAHTLTLLNEFKFDALLLSAGGNDLKNAFNEAFIQSIIHTRANTEMPREVALMTTTPSKADSIFEDVVGYIVQWIALRQKSKLNKHTPVVLHGYDYIQPRPAFARITVNGPKASGPWIYPILKAAGKTDDEMRAMAKDVIDTLNHWLVRLVKPLPNVHLLDTRNTLTIAEPGTTKASKDWMDEIHAVPGGWTKLAERWWNPKLESLLR